MASLENFISSEVMSALMIEQLQKVLVAGDVVNTQYAGTISAAGDSVTIPSLQDFDVSDYTKNQTITYGELDSSSVKLSIDQQKYFAKVVDKIDDDRANMNIVPVVANYGAYIMGKAADTYILQTAMSTDAGITGGTGERALGTSSTAVNVYPDTTAGSGVLGYVGRLAQRLDENDVPQEDRFLIVPPWFHSYLTINKVLETRGIENQETYSNGRVGRLMGFDVRVSNNLTNASAAKSEIFAGHRTSVAFAGNIVDMSIKDLETKFGIGVRGLYIYGSKVVRANALAKGVITQSS